MHQLNHPPNDGLLALKVSGDCAVRAVAHPPGKPKLPGGVDGPVSVEDALHPAVNGKAQGDHRQRVSFL